MKSLFNILIVYTFLLGSCCKAKPDLVTNNIFNNTAFTISITPYSGGISLADFKKDLKPNTKIENIFNCAAGDCFNNKLTIDSLIVIYDGNINIAHLAFNNNASKGLLFANSRNLLSLNNFKAERIKISKCNYETNYSFIFTLQDYLDAKAKQ